MESAIELMTVKLQFIQEKADAGLSPTTQQLAEFMRSLTVELKPSITTCDPEIKEHVREKFSELGWDVGSNRSLSPSPPLVTEVATFLEETIKDLEKINIGNDIDSVKQEKKSPATGTQKINSWEIAATKFDERDRNIRRTVRQGKKGTGTEVHKNAEKTIGLSGQDRASKWANDPKYQIWTEDNAFDAYEWCTEDRHRIPNKKDAGGGRHLKLLNILWNGCDVCHDVIDKNYKAHQHFPNRLDEGRKMYVSSLAKMVLKIVEDYELDQQFESDDEEFEY